MQGQSIKCHLNGKLIHDVKNGTHKAGGIGLGSWSTQVEYKDVSVTTLDGKKLYGGDRTEIIEAALKELGSAGDDLRKEFKALRRRSVRPGHKRWRALYAKVTEFRDALRTAREDIGKIDLPGARSALEKAASGRSERGRTWARTNIARLSAYEKRLNEIKAALATGGKVDVRALVEITAFVKGIMALRGKMFVPDCPPIAFIRRKDYGRRGTNATMLGRGTSIGSSICIYDPARPEKGVKTIFDSRDGFIFDMSPSYDARRLVFSYREKVRDGKDSFHIWEIRVDGRGLRQLTKGRYHDASPIYLPDGRICFSSTRVEAFSMCQNFLAASLFVVDRDGRNLHRIEYNTLCAITPYVLDDGSILFSRWEYQDKNIFCIQGLWTINPDGTRLQLFHGNTLTVPNSVYGARQIPGTRKVVATMAAHHHVPIGAICVIDRSIGLENPKAMVSITPEVPYRPTLGRNWRDRNWGPGDRLYRWGFGDAWPIDKEWFVVIYGGPQHGGPGRYRLFLLNEKGEKVPLYEDPNLSCFNPVPLAPRPLPHVIPGKAPHDHKKGEGTFFLYDVYQGLVNKGVKRGQVKALRVMSAVPKKYNTEGPRYHDHYPLVGYGTYYVKYCHGTVPVHEDGSAYFTAPAGVELYFQALDETGKEIRRMGTVTQITAGETQSCIGCHESRFSAPPMGPSIGRRLEKGPDKITPPPWGAGNVDFVKHVQPVLDKYCVKCHSGPKPPKDVDLSNDKTRFFSIGYKSLIDRRLVDYYYIHDAPTGNFPPFSSGSWVSALTKRIESGHSKVNMDAESRRRIYTWIDANIPYYATWDMSRPHTQGGRDTWNRIKHGRRIEPEPWFQDFMKMYRKVVRKRGPGHTDINLTHPEWSRVLVHNLAKSAGGLADDRKAAFKSKTDPNYVAMLASIEAGKKALLARPRVDMPGAKPIAQQRDFGKTY